MVTISEKELRAFYFTPVEDLSLYTVGFYITPEAGGNTIALGTKAGSAAGVEMFILCDWALATPGTIYNYEVIGDVSSTNPKTVLPDDRSGYPLRVIVRDVLAIT